MARKAKYDWGKTRSSKYQKFETNLTYKTSQSTSTQDSVFIDLAQGLSLINRKLVRQGHVFKVDGLRVWSDDTQADGYDVSVSALPRTWVMFNAYKKARSLWNQMNLETIDALGAGNLSKYYDFKVLFDAEHFKNEIIPTTGDYGTEGNLLPVDQDGNAATAGEWDYSYWEDSQASADRFYGAMLGGHTAADGAAEGSSGRDTPADGGCAGLILAYQQSRGAAFTDQDQSGLDQQVDADSPWAMLFGAGDQEQQIMSALDTQNDAPPYPADYFGGIVHPEGRLIGISHIIGGNSATGTQPMGAAMRSFEAPLGLLKLDFNRSPTSSDTISDIWIQMNAQIVGAC
jgi:hypothetical protein